jgi:hypothetical protein
VGVDARPAGDALVDAEVLGEKRDDLDRRRRHQEDLAAGVEVLLEQLQGFGIDDRGDDVLERLPDDPAHPGLFPSPGDRQHLVPGAFHAGLVGTAHPVDPLVVGALQKRRARQETLPVQRPAERQDGALGDDGLVEVEEGGLHETRQHRSPSP